MSSFHQIGHVHMGFVLTLFKIHHSFQIRSLLENPNEALQLMVERDPSPLPSKRQPERDSYRDDQDENRDTTARTVDIDGTKVQLRPKDILNTHRLAFYTVPLSLR